MTIDAIHNYYEGLVQERIIETDEYQSGNMDQDFFEDVACITLNQLPAKYVRHSVDLIFYMPQKERNDMYVAVDIAIKSALDTISKRGNGSEDKQSP
ncbi:MAG: late competence development ComFB family protein [Gammaproteobacteria bacterium]|nr:late competence development ComFB family protein [Gammaproteobacteria bacterium]MCK5091099.1 late competence development ComFB family protein [Gammaproteobacteria bacterium]